MITLKNELFSGITKPPTKYNGRYIKIESIGSGSFGKIKKVKDTLSNEEIYKLLHEKVNVCQRQFNILSSLDHKNIIKALENFIHKGNDCIVFEYFEKDLFKIIKNSKIVLDETILRIIIEEILFGLEYLHSKGIIHRDIKPENILVNKDGKLVIADFDLARYLEGDPLSKGVATIYYRAPEIFYGSTNYDFSLDIWSLGCLIIELIIKEPIFKGKSEFEVMYKIYEVLSSPNEETWPGCSELPTFFTFGDQKPVRPLNQILHGLVSEELLDLISKMLVLNPHERITASQALKHPLFKNNLDLSTNTTSDLLVQYLFNEYP